MALHLPINGECNIGCVFCSAWGRGGAFEMGYLKNQIDTDTTGHVQISGGDPMLKNPLELLDLLIHCKKQDKIIELQTNATTVAAYDRKRLEQIVKLASFFNVNFSAHTPELDKKVTLIADAFERRMKGVRLLLSLGAKVRLTYIVHSVNFKECAEFVSFVKKELPGIAWIQFSFVKGMGRARGSENVIPRHQDTAPYINEAMKRCLAFGLHVEIDHIPVCFVRDFKDYHADYRKMQEMKPGVHLSEKQKIAECESCNLASWCPGPRVDYVEVHNEV